MSKDNYILEGVLQMFDTKVDSQSRVYPQEVFLKHVPPPNKSSLIEVYESYYENSIKNNLIHTAVYYLERIVKFKMEELMKKHCNGN